MSAIAWTTQNSALAGSNPASASAAASASMSELGGEDFMLLFLAQMRNQNPLEPLDNKDMMQQMLSLNTLSELQKLSSVLTSFGRSNQVINSAAMIGKLVRYTDADGMEQSGVVDSVSVENGTVTLKLEEGGYILLDDVTGVEDAPVTEPAAEPAAGG